MGNISQNVKEFVRNTEHYERFSINDVLSIYPHMNRDSVRMRLTEMTKKDDLQFEKIPPNGEMRGYVIYWKRVNPYKFFISELKPTEPENPRLWA